jgi:preprotein translocase subunit SecG
MTAFLIVLHILVCVFLILFVLLQPGARGGVGAAFGGAGGQTVFGGRGANTFLAKLTAAAAVIFMITSISLSYFVSRSSSVMTGRETPAATETAPADAAKGEAPADAPATGAATDKPADGAAAATAQPAGSAAAPEAAKPAEAPAPATDKPAGEAPPAP